MTSDVPGGEKEKRNGLTFQGKFGVGVMVGNVKVQDRMQENETKHRELDRRKQISMH